MKEIRYRMIRGCQLFGNCPNLEGYTDSEDGMFFNFPPKVGSGYCIGECKYMLFHRAKSKIVGCNYPIEVNPKDRSI